MEMEYTGGLGEYLSLASAIASEIPQAHEPAVALLHDIDTCWRAAVLPLSDGLAPTSNILYMQSFYHWLAGVQMAFSGNATATYPVLRASLEAGCYAYLLHADEDVRNVWLQQDTNPEATKLVKRRFNSAVSSTAERLHGAQPGLATLITSLYEASITFGAHPNPRSTLDHLGEFVTRDDGKIEVRFTALNAANSLNTTRAICAAVEHGLANACLAWMAVPKSDAATAVAKAIGALYARKDAIYPLDASKDDSA
ncbi:MAG: hypothetical protein ABW154_09655 [Dyella sp.]